MENKIKAFRDNLKNNQKFRKVISFVIASFLAIYIFVFCAFGSRPKLFILTYPSLVLLFVALFVYLFVFFEEIKVRLNFRMLIPVLFPALVLLTTLIGTRNFSYLKTTFLLTLTCYASIIAFFCINDVKIILYLIAIPIFSFCIYFLIHYGSTLVHYSGQRLGSFFGNENDVGINLYFGFVFATILGISFKHYWMLGPASLMLLTSITTGSKKVLILSFLFLLFFTYISLRKKKITFLIVVVTVITIFVVLMFMPFFSDIRKRFLSGIPLLSGGDVDASTINRLLFFKTSFYLGTKSIIFGYGGSAFSALSGYGTYAHNNLGEILCDFGLAGVISFYALYPLVTFFVNKKNPKHTLIVFTFLGTFIFCSFTLVFFDSKIYYILLALSLFIAEKDNDKILKKKESLGFYCEVNI